MAEKDRIFSSKVKYAGLFEFADFYRFCYDWLQDDLGMNVVEEKYVEKIKGEEKDIEIGWKASKKVTDYFKFEIGIDFRILGMKKVEVNKDGIKRKMNEGIIEIKISSDIIKDYEGKFEEDAFRKFLRAIYEKWVIPSKISEYKDKLAEDSNDFLDQAKAYLDLESKR